VSGIPSPIGQCSAVLEGTVTHRHRCKFAARGTIMAGSPPWTTHECACGCRWAEEPGQHVALEPHR
jgi:hypothetical protein